MVSLGRRVEPRIRTSVVEANVCAQRLRHPSNGAAAKSSAVCFAIVGSSATVLGLAQTVDSVLGRRHMTAVFMSNM